MCQILEISRSAYYKWLKHEPSERDLENRELLKIIEEIAKSNNQLYGYRKMTMVINKKFEESEKKYNHKRIYRLMCINDLNSRYRSHHKSHWKKSEPQISAENILDRDFNADAPFEKWGTDITEIKVPKVPDKAYLSTDLDFYGTFPLAYEVSRRNDVKLVEDTLDGALEAYPQGAKIFHSDRGFQYTRKEFQKKLKEAGMEQSMSRVGRCIDNGMVESFQGRFKDMLMILHPDISTWDELVEAIDDTFDYYINEYPQERFNGKTSGEVWAEALQAETPKVYPIKPNPQVEKFWNMVEEKKAVH